MPCSAPPRRPLSHPNTHAAATDFVVKATSGGITVMPAPLQVFKRAARANITFPASAFGNRPSGAYLFGAAAIFNGTTSDYCFPVRYTLA